MASEQAAQRQSQQPIHPREHPPQPPPQPGRKEEPEPTEKPDEEKEEPEHAHVTMTAAQFQQIMLSVIAEARKPVKDERAVARVQRMREHNQMLQRDQKQMLIARFRSCNHMQAPGSVMTGCAAIAWATQSDGKKRGTCQHCLTVFSPVREECLSDEIWQAYPMLVRLPTHPAGNLNTVFQSA